VSENNAVKDREREFHDARFGAEIDPRFHLGKYYSITAGAKNCYRNLIRQSASKGGRLLEYGCGTADEMTFFKSLQCEFFGVDISAEAIRRAGEAAQALEFEATYVVADAERTGFDAAYFGTIFGSGILHHLNIDSASRELSRLTADDGECIFFEPMGHNPLINMFRAMTPQLRTPDEHPLLVSDFDIMRRHFAQVDVEFFCLANLLAVPLRVTPLFPAINRALSGLDHWLLSRDNWLQKHSWICVIRMSKPFRV
jgi:SAM-dependent methyltransferase